MVVKPKVYLANPYGFSKVTKTALLVLQYALEDIGFDVYEPFTHTNQKGVETDPHRIMRDDLQAIDDCDIVFAVVNGEAPDVGVAVEVGYAAAKGKPIALFRDDFRQCTDSTEFPVNLMFLAGQPKDNWKASIYTDVKQLSTRNKILKQFKEDYELNNSSSDGLGNSSNNKTNTDEQLHTAAAKGLLGGSSEFLASGKY